MNIPSTDTIKFHELKQEIQSVILQAGVHVSRKESYQRVGIYLLYVDDFSDEKIIPFYIGKTTNFTRRYRDHLRDLKKLLEYDCAEYHNKFFWGATGSRVPFEGKYRPCKILKYLLDHDRTLDDVKMVVLEECYSEYLDEREQYYLSLYLPAFFGFNQIATITEQFAYRNDAQKRKIIIKRDYQYFQLYMEYGYSTFNYLHAFSGYGDENLDNAVDLLLSNRSWLSPKELLSHAIAAHEAYQVAYKEAYAAMSKLLSVSIHDAFLQYGIKSKSREEDVLSAFTNHFSTMVVDSVEQNLDYLRYYFNRNKKCRECGKLIEMLYEAHIDEIHKISEPVMSLFEIYIESRIQAIEQSEYSVIFPKFPYEDKRQRVKGF